MGRKIETRDGVQRTLGVKAAAVIKLGDMVFHDAGIAVPGASGSAAEFAFEPVGVAEDDVTGSGVDGEVKVTTRRGIFLMDNNPADLVTVDRIGSPCFAIDATTVSKNAGGNTRPAAGTVFDVDARGVWVEFA